jgi:hypothetical protein
MRASPHRIAFVAMVLAIAMAPKTEAGTGYEIIAGEGKTAVQYEVRFGGGRISDQMTGYDPATKTFVYLSWKRGTDKPKPAGSIWDHTTGKTIPLYEFPGAKVPLPEIPSIDELTRCPITGGAITGKKKTIIYD